MTMRFARGASLTIAMGLVMSGGGALAATPDITIGVEWGVGKPAPFGGTRFDGAVFDKKVYFLGFRLADNSTDGSIWYYDIKKKKYVDTGDEMAVPVTNYTVAVLQDKTGTGLYTFGGRDANGATTNTVQAYYPKTGTTKIYNKDKWPGKTPSDCVSLPATGVAVADNKAYVVGGMSFSTSIPACVDDNSKEVFSFDPKAKDGKKWKKQPSLKTARGYIATAVVKGNTIFAIGGDVNASGTLTASPVVEAWKIGSGSWNDADYADLPVGCDESQAFAFDSGTLIGTITLAGCGQWPNATPDVYQYKVSTNKWSMMPTGLNEARRNQAGANIGTATKPVLFLLGGYDATGANVLMTSEVTTKPGPAPEIQGPVASIPVTGGRPALF